MVMIQEDRFNEMFFWPENRAFYNIILLQQHYEDFLRQVPEEKRSDRSFFHFLIDKEYQDKAPLISGELTVIVASQINQAISRRNYLKDPL